MYAIFSMARLCARFAPLRATRQFIVQTGRAIRIVVSTHAVIFADKIFLRKTGSRITLPPVKNNLELVPRESILRLHYTARQMMRKAEMLRSATFISSSVKIIHFLLNFTPIFGVDTIFISRCSDILASQISFPLKGSHTQVSRVSHRKDAYTAILIRSIVAHYLKNILSFKMPVNKRP